MKFWLSEGPSVGSSVSAGFYLFFNFFFFFVFLFPFKYWRELERDSVSNHRELSERFP